MAKSGKKSSKKKSSGTGRKKKKQVLSEFEREKNEIHILHMELVGAKKWIVKDIWLDAHPRKPEKNWNYDKLGRPFHIGQVIVWFSQGKYGLTERFALITTYHMDLGAYYAYPIKSDQYISPEEKKLTRFGDAFIVNTRLEVKRLRQEYGAVIIGSLYNPWFRRTDLFPTPHIGK